MSNGTMEKPYVYQEYPKLLYGPNGIRARVDSAEEEKCKKAEFEALAGNNEPNGLQVSESLPTANSGVTEAIHEGIPEKPRRGRPKKGK